MAIGLGSHSVSDFTPARAKFLAEKQESPMSSMSAEIKRSNSEGKQQHETTGSTKRRVRNDVMKHN
jgi:hypothetical protein